MARNTSVTAKDLHFYEPANGHGLKHDPFNAIIAPRPIGWISSRDAKGHINLAPYSFFNGFCYHPPIIGFFSSPSEEDGPKLPETQKNTRDLSSQKHAGEAMH